MADKNIRLTNALAIKRVPGVRRSMDQGIAFGFSCTVRMVTILLLCVQRITRFTQGPWFYSNKRMVRIIFLRNDIGGGGTGPAFRIVEETRARYMCRRSGPSMAPDLGDSPRLCPIHGLTSKRSRHICAFRWRTCRSGRVAPKFHVRVGAIGTFFAVRRSSAGHLAACWRASREKS